MGRHPIVVRDVAGGTLVARAWGPPPATAPPARPTDAAWLAAAPATAPPARPCPVNSEAHAHAVLSEAQGLSAEEGPWFVTHEGELYGRIDSSVTTRRIVRQQINNRHHLINPGGSEDNRHQWCTIADSRQPIADADSRRQPAPVVAHHPRSTTATTCAPEDKIDTIHHDQLRIERKLDQVCSTFEQVCFRLDELPPQGHSEAPSVELLELHLRAIEDSMATQLRLRVIEDKMGVLEDKMGAVGDKLDQLHLTFRSIVRALPLS